MVSTLAAALLAALGLSGVPATHATAPVGGTFFVSGHGWGHGVGLAQYGAYGYALHGWTYDRIVKHYYTGTTIGKDNRHWLVSALGFELEMELAPLLIFFRYDDLPGVIGRVGTLFGTAGVNIANMAVSRTNRGGKALMALSVDSPPPQELVDEARREGFDDVRFISLS